MSRRFNSNQSSSLYIFSQLILRSATPPPGLSPTNRHAEILGGVGILKKLGHDPADLGELCARRVQRRGGEFVAAICYGQFRCGERFLRGPGSHEMSGSSSVVAMRSARLDVDDRGGIIGIRIFFGCRILKSQSPFTLPRVRLISPAFGASGLTLTFSNRLDIPFAASSSTRYGLRAVGNVRLDCSSFPDS